MEPGPQCGRSRFPGDSIATGGLGRPPGVSELSSTRLPSYPGVGRNVQPVCAANPVHVDALVLRQIQRLRPGVVLDVGCATGRFARLLDDCRVVGVELDPAYAAEAARWCVEVIQGDIEEGRTQQKASAEGPYDLILLLDVLEHLVHPEQCLDSLADADASGGTHPGLKYEPPLLPAPDSACTGQIRDGGGRWLV